MSFVNGSMNYRIFQVEKEEDVKLDLDFIKEGLCSGAFCELSAESEESCGFVNIGEYKNTTTTNTRNFDFGFAAFSFRIDKKRVPGSLLKKTLEKLTTEYLESHPGKDTLDKKTKKKLKDAAKEQLLRKAEPVPSLYDIVWDYRNGRLYFFNLSEKTIEKMAEKFAMSFIGTRLVPSTVYERCESLCTDELKSRLIECAGTSSSNIAEIIESNRWIGEDFITWLLYRAHNGMSSYGDNTDMFAAYPDYMFVLADNNTDSCQKVKITGEQIHCLEIKTALNEGKTIEQATLVIDTPKEPLHFTLISKTFDIKGLKIPNELVKGLDPDTAIEIRYSILEYLEQAINVLLIEYLQTRLSAKWESEEVVKIQQWCKHGLLENAA
jgi:DNA recombination-dependent growth factor C